MIPLVPADVPDLTRLHRECFPLDQVWSALSFAELLADKGHIGWRLEVGGHTVGFILGRIIMDEAELLTLAVSPACQRQGLGKALLGQFVTTLGQRGVVKAFLEVEEHNEGAIKLYTGANFRLISRRFNYYPGGATAFVYQLDLH